MLTLTKNYINRISFIIEIWIINPEIAKYIVFACLNSNLWVSEHNICFIIDHSFFSCLNIIVLSISQRKDRCSANLFGMLVKRNFRITAEVIIALSLTEKDNIGIVINKLMNIILDIFIESVEMLCSKYLLLRRIFNYAC